MYKTVCFVAFMGVLLSVVVAKHPFSSYHNVTWNSTSNSWNMDGISLGEISAAGGKIVLINVTTPGGGDFYISSTHCGSGARYALTRKEGVTNNYCKTPCVLAMNLTTGSYFYCSSLYPMSAAGFVFVMNCDECSRRTCSDVIGCGWSSSTSKCTDCISAKTKSECSTISSCSWCDVDGVCLHEKSGACRQAIPRVRVTASWVWLVITLCALLILIAVFITLFLTEANFKKRWASLSKVDKEFAEIGRGNNDGLGATD